MRLAMAARLCPFRQLQPSYWREVSAVRCHLNRFVGLPGASFAITANALSQAGNFSLCVEPFVIALSPSFRCDRIAPTQ